MGLEASVFQAHNKTEEACASSVVVIVGTPLRVDCRSALAFPTSSGSAFVLPFGCQSRALPPAVLYRRVKRLSQGTANPSRVTLMVRPLFLAEPGLGDALRTTRALAVFFHPTAIRRVGLRQSRFPSVSGLAAFLFLPATPVFRPVGFHLTGELRYSWQGLLSKIKQGQLGALIQSPYHYRITSS